jgi:hypothetical protein
MTEAVTYDMTIEQGSWFSKKFVWKGADGNPLDLTGYTARMQVRPAPKRTPIFLSLTTENSGITLGGTAGSIVIEASDELTAALDFNNAYYDLEMISPTDRPLKLLKGKVSLYKEITV